ncbi:NAD(P)-binding domain-containing protein [Spirosoma aureum]|uniref:NAD(P)-binding domain-containing protein n=1 Tax=Spirosoma aureum TaxID=2692134 RepID=A0A6G9ATK1_9BACT|nr:NAD(P)-binding domain-containing protein [Spirosoma aureum]QIP15817.1 NAD(P)-binding domain-containing protein [Spirosoma aureum]
MKVGVIGSGTVGQSLAKAFVSEGHDVILGTRNPNKEDIVTLKNENPSLTIDTPAQAAAFGEVVVLAVPGTAALESLQQAGPANFEGKILIDVTNPLAAEAPVNGVPKLFTTSDESLLESIQKLLPTAKVVKALNNVGAFLMYKPTFQGGKGTVFIAGNDEEAKATVSEILESFGWEAENVGKAEAARAIEPLGQLYVARGMLNNDWAVSLKLVRL